MDAVERAWLGRILRIGMDQFACARLIEESHLQNRKLDTGDLEGKYGIVNSLGTAKHDQLGSVRNGTRFENRFG